MVCKVSMADLIESRSTDGRPDVLSGVADGSGYSALHTDMNTILTRPSCVCAEFDVLTAAKGVKVARRVKLHTRDGPSGKGGEEGECDGGEHRQRVSKVRGGEDYAM